MERVSVSESYLGSLALACGISSAWLVREALCEKSALILSSDGCLFIDHVLFFPHMANHSDLRYSLGWLWSPDIGASIT